MSLDQEGAARILKSGDWRSDVNACSSLMSFMVGNPVDTLEWDINSKKEFIVHAVSVCPDLVREFALKRVVQSFEMLPFLRDEMHILSDEDMALRSNRGICPEI